MPLLKFDVLNRWTGSPSGGQSHFLGYHNTEAEALSAYAAAASNLFGPFARSAS